MFCKTCRRKEYWNIRTCDMVRGNWLLAVSPCAMNCISLPSIVHGHNSFHNLLSLGTTVHVYCYIRYVVDGPNHMWRARLG